MLSPFPCLEDEVGRRNIEGFCTNKNKGNALIVVKVSGRRCCVYAVHKCRAAQNRAGMHF